ncbi:ABC transporter permease [Mesobacillus zeae]|uniref:ABC transporter permease n=1 Tax=Mesobacillus zeae TaxID=1917180 RepID=A0A398B212_9BACI|nr:ABC transporter permease subunit [Mesobacillus zeae]RID83364.1 ABC transporter permease [Mesobacillus zeae]
MKPFIAFTKKEMLEYSRSYKIFIFLILFAILGMLSPLSAVFMDDILENFMPKGVKIEITDPTNLDSWMQFFKNGTQTGLMIMVILFSGMMAKEYEKSTLINMVTKGLSRKTVVLSKFTAALILWTVSYWLCFLITLAYTKYYFPDGKTANLGLAVFSLYVFGIMLIAVLLLGAVTFKNVYGPLLLTGGFTLILFLVNIFPKAAEWNPLQLANSNMRVVQGILKLSDLKYSLLTAAIVVAVSLVSSLKIFDRKGL